MNVTYLVVNMLNSKHPMLLGPDDSTSFPTVHGANKVHFSSSKKFLSGTKKIVKAAHIGAQKVSLPYTTVFCLWPIQGIYGPTFA